MIPSPHTPLQFTTADGTSLTVREMLPADIPKFYSALLTAMKSGVGYGIDELPNLDYFVKYYVDGWRNMVIELTDTAEPVAYGNTDGPTAYSRSVSDPVIADGGNMLVLEKYRGKGWYVEMISKMSMESSENDKIVHSGRPVIVGYQGDMALTNMATYKGDRNFGFRVNGVLPRGIYLQEHGWVDVLLVYVNRDESVAVKRLIDGSRRATPNCQIMTRESGFGMTTVGNSKL